MRNSVSNKNLLFNFLKEILSPQKDIVNKPQFFRKNSPKIKQITSTLVIINLQWRNYRKNIWIKKQNAFCFFPRSPNLSIISNKACLNLTMRIVSREIEGKKTKVKEKQLINN